MKCSPLLISYSDVRCRSFLNMGMIFFTAWLKATLLRGESASDVAQHPGLCRRSLEDLRRAVCQIRKEKRYEIRVCCGLHRHCLRRCDVQVQSEPIQHSSGESRSDILACTGCDVHRHRPDKWHCRRGEPRGACRCRHQSELVVRHSDSERLCGGRDNGVIGTSGGESEVRSRRAASLAERMGCRWQR